MHCENKPLLQADPRFFQDITSSAVEVGLAKKILQPDPCIRLGIAIFNDDSSL
jgi:hypothetical protein